jgi:type III secretion protein L
LSSSSPRPSRRADLLEAALQRVDTLVREEPFITVRVAAGQEAPVREALQRLEPGGMPWLGKVRVVVDGTLAERACVLQTPSGVLAIGVDAQIEAFRAAVERSGLVDDGQAVP